MERTRALKDRDKVPAAWDYSQELKSLRVPQPFFDRLSTSVPARHNIFLVSRPSSLLPKATDHWSLYCQGRYYHLAAPGLAQDSFAATSSGLDLLKVPVALKVQDFSHPETMPPQQTQVALVAYHVGNTDYPAEQIEKLAKWIIDSLHTYYFFEVNCHLFVLSLMERIVMTGCHYSVFAGTTAQLAHWDLVGRQQSQRFFDIDHGFLIRESKADTSITLWQSVPFAYLTLFVI